MELTGRADRRRFSRWLDDPPFPPERGRRGAEHLVRSCPGLALLVQASPAFCCPSLVAEAMAGRIERATGVPW